MIVYCVRSVVLYEVSCVEYCCRKNCLRALVLANCLAFLHSLGYFWANCNSVGINRNTMMLKYGVLKPLCS